MPAAAPPILPFGVWITLPVLANEMSKFTNLEARLSVDALEIGVPAKNT